MIGLILAAGQGARLGGVNKAALISDGVRFLQVVADGAHYAGCDQVWVVVGGPHQNEVAEAAAGLGLSAVVNPAADRGMSSSIATGFARLLTTGDNAALLWPVDHAFVLPKTARQVAQSLEDFSAVIPTFNNRGGHPVAVGRDLWAALSTCDESPEGARTVFRSHQYSVRRLAVDDAGVLRDVDEVADLP